MNKNILEICLSPDLGGLELFVASCYKSFKNNNLNTKIVVQKGKKLDDFLGNEIDKFYLKRNKFFPFIPAIKLANYFDKNEIDIVHFHWTKDISLVVLAKFFSKRKPKIMQSRHMTMTRFKSDFYHKFLYKNISCIHAVTNQVKMQCEKFIPNHIRPSINMIYIGVEAKNIDPKKILQLKQKYCLENSFTIGIVGRIEEVKGQYLVIEAISKLKDLNIKALIIGHTMDEEYLSSLKQKVKALNIEDKIIFTGFTKDVNEHMQLLDINILATKNETFGLVVIEAMINKICVIATNKGGPLEIIEDGIDGILFNRTSEDLANKIKFLYENIESKEVLAQNGAKKANEIFNSEAQLEKLYKLAEAL